METRTVTNDDGDCLWTTVVFEKSALLDLKAFHGDEAVEHFIAGTIEEFADALRKSAERVLKSDS